MTRTYTIIGFNSNGFAMADGVAEAGKLVIPGDQVVRSTSLAPSAVVRAGTGLAEEGSGLVAMRSGTVRVLSPKDGAGDTHVWVDSNARRYSPCVQVCVRKWDNGANPHLLCFCASVHL